MLNCNQRAASGRLSLRRSIAVLLSALVGLSFCAASPLLQAAEPVSRPVDGQSLASQLRAMLPSQNTEVRGTMQIHLKRMRRSIPFVCQVVRQETNWQSIFKASATSETPAEILVVVHSPTVRNQYYYARAETPTNAVPRPAEISEQKAAVTAFAGSDFTLSDLGVDFLYWPSQQLLRSQTRLNRLCYVLESRNDRAPEVVRVRAFIDQEFSGSLGSQGFPALLVAEGYDINNNMVKEFSLSGSSFKKVDGQWQLRKVGIDNLKTGSQTVLEFDLTE